MKLSIIIPIYNVEAYLSDCLASVFGQHIDEADYEVICVDDGTPDNSVEIVRRHMASHPNIRLVSQPNQGVSVARNRGLSEAQGDYVLFLDSDDRLSDGSLEALSARLNLTQGADALICNFIRGGSYSYCWHGTFSETTDYAGPEILNGGLLCGSVMAVCFRRAFLGKNGIAFLAGIKNGEDTNFMMQCLFYAGRVQFCDIDLYEVVERDGSASRLFTSQRIDSMIEAVKAVCRQREQLLGREGNRMVLDYMVYTMFLNLVKDTARTPGLGYRYLRRAGVDRYAKFRLSPDTVFLRSKMRLLTTSFATFYFIRKLCLAIR